MATVAIKDEYAEMLKAFGDLEDGVDLALRRYAIEQITAKIKELRDENSAYEARYGMDYPTFCKRIAEDEAFVRHVEDSVNKMWEIDLADWEFCCKGIEDWTQKLQAVLLT